MGDGDRTSGIERAASVLRARILAEADGARLGNEEELLPELGVSRSTLRQVARILEREGLLQVRRGINGGYYAVRPDLGTIEAAVSGHLRTLHVTPDDATMIASALWVETMRKAAAAPPDSVRRIVDDFAPRVAAVAPDAPFNAILTLEQAFREAIFDLLDSRYVQLIFRINTAFAAGSFRPNAERDDSPGHAAFVQAWRTARQIELATLADGDPELAAVASRRLRAIWAARVSQQEGTA